MGKPVGQDIKAAHELRHDSSREKIRIILYHDGVINCCSMDSEGMEKCCFTSPPREEEAYWAFLNYLTKEKNYRAIELGEVSPQRLCPVCSSLKSLKEVVSQARI